RRAGFNGDRLLRRLPEGSHEPVAGLPDHDREHRLGGDIELDRSELRRLHRQHVDGEPDVLHLVGRADRRAAAVRRREELTRRTAYANAGSRKTPRVALMLVDQTGLTFEACGPFCPWVTSNSTF